MENVVRVSQEFTQIQDTNYLHGTVHCVSISLKINCVLITKSEKFGGLGGSHGDPARYCFLLEASFF